MRARSGGSKCTADVRIGCLVDRRPPLLAVRLSMGCTLVAVLSALLVCVSAETSQRPNVYSMHIVSEVRNRFAKTLVTSRVANPANHSQEINFDAVLPEKAFISRFVIEMDGKSYEAYVRGKEEAKQEYSAAVAAGIGAAHVALSARDSNVVHVSLNVEAGKKVTFNLTYEELLQRELGAYILRLNINPGQLVDDLSVEVRIDEKTPLKFVQVPSLQEKNEVVDFPDNDTDPLAVVERPSASSALVRWTPTKAQQVERSAEGLQGQLLVRYDVDRDASPDQILVSEDGYFVHFYAPPGLPALPKHVVFVLDVSGSMHGRKIEQLKTAMFTILDELNEGDTFSLVPFSSKVQVWQPDVPLEFGSWFEESLNPPFNSSAIVPATKENVAKAKQSVSSFEANGGTYMYSALKTALRVSDAGGAGHSGRRRHAPMLVLLTDGEPNGQVSEPNEIVRLVTALNAESGAALFTLAFGIGADYGFLRRLALRNGGVGRRIYEAADAHLQLRDFYRQIASPLLADVTFNYDGDKVDEESLTTATFPTLFLGGELVVAGRLSVDASSAATEPFCTVQTDGGNVTVTTPAVANASSAERLWAFLTVRQLLDQDAATPNSTIRDKAKAIALKYSFVTGVTSLVVVKPNETSAVDLDPSDVPDSRPSFLAAAVPLSIGLHGVRGASLPAHHHVQFGPPVNYYPKMRPVSVHGLQPGSMMHSISRQPVAVSGESFDDAVDVQTVGETVASTFHESSPIPVAEQTLSLSDVGWLDQVRNGTHVTLTVNGTDQHFQLAVNQTGGAFGGCVTPQKPGVCRHLAACVLQAFANDLQAFLSGYLCIADNSFLGACCPEDIHVGSRR